VIPIGGREGGRKGRRVRDGHHFGARPKEGEFGDGFLVELGVVEDVDATEGGSAHFFLGDTYRRGREGGRERGSEVRKKHGA